MSTSRTMALLAALLVFASAALAGRATSLLDGLESALTDVVEFESAQETPDKKRLKTAQKALRKLGKDTSTGAADLGLFKKIAGPVAKRFSEDMAVAQATDDAIAAAEAEIVGLIADVRSRIGSAPTKKKPTKAEKAAKLANSAESKLERARAATKTKKKVAQLLVARKKADKAAALAADLPPGNDTLRPLGPDPIARVAYFDLDRQRAVLDAINLRTGEKTTLSDPGVDVELRRPAPLASPTGDHIAFLQGTQLRVTDGTSTATAPVEADWATFTFSPDGTLLAALDPTAPVLGVFDTNGNTIVQVSEVFSTSLREQSVVWAPDSSAFAVRGIRNDDNEQQVVIFEGPTFTSSHVASGDGPPNARVNQMIWSDDAQNVIYFELIQASSRDTEVVVVNRAGTERRTVSVPGEDPRSVLEEQGGKVLYVAESGGNEILSAVALDGTGHVVVETADEILQANLIEDGTFALRIADGDFVQGPTDPLITADPSNTFTFGSGCTSYEYVGYSALPGGPAVPGGAAVCRVEPQASADYLGYVDVGGDFDGDGYDDLVSGAYSTDGYSAAAYGGGVYLWFGERSGRIGGSTRDPSTGEPYAYMDDIQLGAYDADTPYDPATTYSEYAGAVYLFDGGPPGSGRLRYGGVLANSSRGTIHVYSGDVLVTPGAAGSRPEYEIGRPAMRTLRAFQYLFLGTGL